MMGRLHTDVFFQDRYMFFLLVKCRVFPVLGVFVDAFATQNRRFCNVFRASLRR